jgi:hypothetical protein
MEKRTILSEFRTGVVRVTMKFCSNKGDSIGLKIQNNKTEEEKKRERRKKEDRRKQQQVSPPHMTRSQLFLS